MLHKGISYKLSIHKIIRTIALKYLTSRPVRSTRNSSDMNYKQINNLTGWLVFAMAALVYIITSEPTTSFWDCGEYIATAAGLQVGHPPGAPLFQMLGRFFSLFAFGNEMLVARMVNTMSALSSAFTILFLFWTITHLAGKIVKSFPDKFPNPTPAIIGSGLIGALTYTFSDSFWFSAVEGEVYAMSSFFTAFVFWAILKWESETVGYKDNAINSNSSGRQNSDSNKSGLTGNHDNDHSIRWIILIAFMIGLSIGVHLLNLLTIPAVALVIYYKKYQPTFKGTILALFISIVVLALVMNFIIPWIVKLAGWFELFFVNSLGMPFNTGTVIYFLLLVSILIWALRYTRHKAKVLWNTIALSFTFILIGYSSFFMLVIRAEANTPINENEPTNAISLLSYLNREQYGDWPLLYGPYYNAPVVDYEDGNPVYHKDTRTGKYEIINERKDYEPVYDEEFMTVFPRMWSSSENSHSYFYKRWGKIKGTAVKATGADGKNQTIMKPTFGENLRFFYDYQIQHMYVRYFMWNFAGKQNDRQSFGDDLNGNWISGIKFMDEWRLGPQDNLPESMHSKAHNVYFMLPLLLGLIGLIFHVNHRPKDSLVVTLLFIMTGLAIVVYLNQYAPQPRERDYAYAASFYAFAIWIGLGVLSLSALISKYLKIKQAGIIATVICLVVPTIMAAQNWNDHDRSGRYTARDIARNYLESCEKDAILFTMADNDTFPLWYVQEVEGIRTDVRVVNLSLLNSDWYVGQMKRKVYESDPLPISLEYDQFKSGTFDVIYIAPDERIQGAISLTELFDVMRKQPEALRLESTMGPVDVIPASEFAIPVDSALVMSNGTVRPEEADSLLSILQWSIKDRVITKSQIILLDILAHNNWKRPVYFSSTATPESYLGLNLYLRNEGFALRLVPVKESIEGNFEGYINSGVLYDKLMNVYRYGNMEDPAVYLDETNTRVVNNLRTMFGRLAKQLVKEGKNKEAIAVCDKCLATMPNESLAYNYYLMQIAESYLAAGAKDKGIALLNKLLELYSADLNYYFRFPEHRLKAIEQDIRQSLMVINGITSMATEYNDRGLKEKATLELDKQFERYEEAGF